MATLILKPGANKATATEKSPVRRADPATRSRAKPPAQDRHEGVPPTKPVGATPSSRPEAAPRPENQRQRNHRFDGKPKDSKPRQDNISKVGGQDRDTPRRGGKMRDGFVPGEFNKHRATNPKFAPKPTATNSNVTEDKLPRLSKRMAELGLCSRREADEWISNGWVTVDDKVIDILGTRISPNARIEVSNAARKHQSETVTIILHKPMGYVSAQAEDGYQPAVVLIHPDNQWTEDSSQTIFQRGHLQGLAPAGRLDIDSTGLLVFTQDGRVARHLIGDDSSVEKEYLVRVEGELSAAGLKLLNHGLELDGVQLKPAKVSWQNEDQLRFVLREGRKRQIRRMCELVGLAAVGLKRVRIGSVTLGKLPVGNWRYLQLGERF